MVGGTRQYIRVEKDADLEKRAVFQMTPFSPKEHYFGCLREPVWNLGLSSAKLALFSHGTHGDGSSILKDSIKIELHRELSYGQSKKSHFGSLFFSVLTGWCKDILTGFSSSEL